MGSRAAHFSSFLLWWIAAVLLLGTFTISAQGYWAVGLFQAGIFVLALTALLRGGVAERRFPLDPPSILLAIPLLCGLLQLALGTSGYPHATWIATLQWGALFCLALIVRSILEAPEALQKFLSLFLGTAIIVSAYVLIQPYIGPYHLGGLAPVRTEDMAGPFQNRNTFASFIELAVPVAGYRALRCRRDNWMYWMAIGIMFASVVSSASRAGSALVAIGEFPVSVHDCV